jgi:surfeit locus 1 family protein
MHKQPFLRFHPVFSLKIGRCCFAPGLASTLMVLCVVPLLLFLSYWQWQRFQYKTAHTPTRETRKLLLTLLEANILQKEGALQDLQASYLQTEGQFLNQYAIFVDNQSFKGQPGYKVLTPLLVARQPSPTYLLVDRGWIPLGQSRAILPTLPPITGMIHIEGRLYQPVQGFKLPRLPHPPSLRYGGQAPLPPHAEHLWPLRVLDIDLQTLEQALGHTVYPLILRLEPGDTLGFEILPFSTQIGMPPIKHLGYAWQWFMMALTVLIYYVVINTSFIKPSSINTTNN